MDIPAIAKVLAVLAIAALLYVLYKNHVAKKDGFATWLPEDLDMEDSDASDDEDEDMELESGPLTALTPTGSMMTASSQLLPQLSAQTADFAQFAPKDIGAQNLLTPSQFVGLNTVGNSRKNANYDLRPRPPIPKQNIGPWQMSSYEANPYERNIFA